MKKLRLYCLLLVTVLLAYPVLSMADGDTSIQIAETEWTWEENSIAFFEGKASLEGMPEGKLLLKMTFSTEPKATDPGEVVFHTVNGKKLTLRKQKAEYMLDPKGQDTLEFTGIWKTPDDVFFTKIDIDLQICSEDGSNVLDRNRLTVSRNAYEMAEKDDGKIRLKIDASAWIIRIMIASGVIWTLAIVRIIVHKISRKKER